jgi:RimJ/RimL family protein N-acetyltransferase
VTVDEVVVRPFATDEWLLYRAIRLEALLADPRLFSSSHAIESAMPDDWWQSRVADDDVGIFGVFLDGGIIGLTGVAVSREDPSVALLWGSWLAPSHRGHGYSVPMYEARLAWARARPQIRRVTVSHRQGNLVSARANQKHGFVFSHTADLLWRDGITEPEVCYSLDL